MKVTLELFKGRKRFWDKGTQGEPLRGLQVARKKVAWQLYLHRRTGSLHMCFAEICFPLLVPA